MGRLVPRVLSVSAGWAASSPRWVVDVAATGCRRWPVAGGRGRIVSVSVLVRIDRRHPTDVEDLLQLLRNGFGFGILLHPHLDLVVAVVDLSRKNSSTVGEAKAS